MVQRGAIGQQFQSFAGASGLAGGIFAVLLITELLGGRSLADLVAQRSSAVAVDRLSGAASAVVPDTAASAAQHHSALQASAAAAVASGDVVGDGDGLHGFRFGMRKQYHLTQPCAT